MGGGGEGRFHIQEEARAPEINENMTFYSKKDHFLFAFEVLRWQGTPCDEVY